jgi:hypothetical protein
VKANDSNMPADSMVTSDASIRGGTGGSLGGASEADLRRGYTDAEAPAPERPDAPVPPWVEREPGGFLNRPRGWER